MNPEQDLDIEIISLYKEGQGPFEDLSSQGYFGKRGIVLFNKKTRKLQCHWCGGWFSRLVTHAVMEHKVTGEKFRKKFGLSLHKPLCNPEESAKSRESYLLGIAKHSEDIKNGTLIKATKASQKKKSKKNHFYAYHNSQWDNEHDCCDEQLRKRYEIVADTVGGEPSKNQIEQLDSGLASYIIRKFGSINKFRKKNGYQIVKSNPKVTDTKIIAALRGFIRKWHRVPRPKDFLTGTPNQKTILRRFGSWKAALGMAGLIK